MYKTIDQNHKYFGVRKKFDGGNISCHVMQEKIKGKHVWYSLFLRDREYYTMLKINAKFYEHQDQRLLGQALTAIFKDEKKEFIKNEG